MCTQSGYIACSMVGDTEKGRKSKCFYDPKRLSYPQTGDKIEVRNSKQGKHQNGYKMAAVLGALMGAKCVHYRFRLGGPQSVHEARVAT